MQEERMFKELIESSDDIIIVTDRDFRIRYISSSVTKAFGIEPVKLLGLNIFNFVGADKVENWRQCLLDPTYTTFHEEISLRLTPDKKAYFDIQVSNLFNKSNIQGLMLKLHDITAKKSREKELIRSNQQLDQVIYKTTHDLRTPLMSAMGLVNLAEKAPAEDKPRYLELIKKSLLKLDLFIEEMNNLFRNEKLAVKQDKLNIVALLKEELENFRSLYEDAKTDIRFEVQQEADFYSDGVRIRSIVSNVLSNAIKYRDPKKSEPFIKISVHINEDFCEIYIIDNGIGIEPQYHEKIFDLFFRATSQSQGTGLGLFIVKDTIEKLKGKIEVNSIPDQETTFRIQIPNKINQPIEVG